MNLPETPVTDLSAFGTPDNPHTGGFHYRLLWQTAGNNPAHPGYNYTLDTNTNELDFFVWKRGSLRANFTVKN